MSVRPGAVYLAGAPLLIAHRGGSALAPENTMTAFQQAVDWWGADILELDVQATRDGEAVVFHDDTVDRTTDGRGPVRAGTLEALKRLDAGYRFTADGGKTYPYRAAGTAISTFEEVLASFPRHRINVEIKSAAAQERVWEVVHAAGATRRVLVAAGKHANRARFREYDGPTSASGRELRAFYLAHRIGAARHLPLPVDALQMPDRYGQKQIVSQKLVQDAHAVNLAVHVWTVDEIAEMERLLDWRIDGIVTDRPDRLAYLLHRRAGRPLPPGPRPGEAPPSVERLLRATGAPGA